VLQGGYLPELMCHLVNFRLTVPSGSSSAGYSSFESTTVQCVVSLLYQSSTSSQDMAATECLAHHATNFTRSRISQRMFSDHLALWRIWTHTDKHPSSNDTRRWISHVWIGIRKLWLLHWLISDAVWNKLRADLPVSQIFKKNLHRSPPG